MEQFKLEQFEKENISLKFQDFYLKIKQEILTWKFLAQPSTWNYFPNQNSYIVFGLQNSINRHYKLFLFLDYNPDKTFYCEINFSKETSVIIDKLNQEFVGTRFGFIKESDKYRYRFWIIIKAASQEEFELTIKLLKRSIELLNEEFQYNLE